MMQEANFYYCAAYGEPIPQSLWAAGDGSSPGERPEGCKRNPKLSTTAKQYASEIAWDELGHVKLLRDTLGPRAVAQPKINIGSAFVDAANLAASLALNTSITLAPPFDPYVSDIFFYHGAFIFEDVGATAYAVSGWRGGLGACVRGWAHL